MDSREPSQALFADLYQLTMAQAYWESGRTATATFSLFFRKYPSDRGYAVFGGLADALEHLQDFKFSSHDIDLLRSLGRFDESFTRYLADMRFTGSVRAMPEGSIFFANEPVIEVTAPIIEAQLVETFLLNQVSLQSILATKASRVMHVARGKSMVDFAARRTHGTDAADKLARVSYMVGFSGTSNVHAGVIYGIPTFGTMAHSFVMTFEEEADAYRAYASTFPDSSTFLVDTYDTVEGTRKAVQVARELKRAGHRPPSIRLDSGDLNDLAKKARAILDDAGLSDVEIFASGGLDEFGVDDLLSGGAPIDGFGVGTKLGVSADAPWMDCVYKLVAYESRPVLKLSAEKSTLPGPKQVYRLRDDEAVYRRDVLACADERPPSEDADPLLREVMSGGKQLAPPSSLQELREHFTREFVSLPGRYKALRSPPEYPVEISDSLDRLRWDVVRKMGRQAEPR